VCSTCARPRGAFLSLSSPRPQPQPSGCSLPFPRQFLCLRLASHFPPFHLPFRCSTRPFPTPDRHSGVLFPGQGDLWGEQSATRNGAGPCNPGHAALLQGSSACGAPAREIPRLQFRTEGYRPGLAALAWPTSLASLGQIPPQSPPGSRVPQLCAVPVTPGGGQCRWETLVSLICAVGMMPDGSQC
jgi:hypothetical protein